MKSTKHFFSFVVFFSIILVFIFFINMNLSSIIPDYRDRMEQQQIQLKEEKSDLIVMDKIYSYRNKSFATYTTKKLQEEFIKKLDSAFFPEGLKVNNYYLGTKEELEQAEYVQILSKYDTASLLYVKEEQKIHYSLDYSISVYTEEVIAIEGKEQLIRVSKEKLDLLDIEPFRDFEPNIIWKIGKNIYALKDNQGDITVNYDLTRDLLIGLSAPWKL